MVFELVSKDLEIVSNFNTSICARSDSSTELGSDELWDVDSCRPIGLTSARRGKASVSGFWMLMRQVAPVSELVECASNVYRT
jgi:hypothetical protein